MNLDQAFLELHELQLKREKLDREISRIDEQRYDLAKEILTQIKHNHCNRWLIVQDRLIAYVAIDTDLQDSRCAITFEFLGDVKDAGRGAIETDADGLPF